MIFAAGSASAQYVMKVNVSGTLTIQEPNSGSPTVKETTKSGKFNNKTIITLLNASATFKSAAEISSIPTGSYLVVNTDSGDVIITNKTGFSVDLTTTTYGEGETPFALITDGDLELTKGSYNDTTGVYNEQSMKVTESLTI